MQRHLTNVRWGTYWSSSLQMQWGWKKFHLELDAFDNKSPHWRGVMEMCGQGPSPGSACTRPQITRLSEKLHRYNVHGKTLTWSSNLWNMKGFILESKHAQVMIIVFFTRYSHFGHNEVIYADQKLNRYTEYENTSKKASMSSRFTKKFILGRIFIDVMNLLSF